MSYSKTPGQIAFERWHSEHRTYDGTPRYWKDLTIYDRDVWENLPGAQRMAAALGDLKKENLEKMSDPPVFSGCDLASGADQTALSVWRHGIVKAMYVPRDRLDADERAARADGQAIRADEQAMIALIVQSDEYRKGMAAEAERLVAAYPDLFWPADTVEQAADRRSEGAWDVYGRPGGALPPEEAKGYRAPARRHLPREHHVDGIAAVMNKAARRGSHLLGAVDAYED